MHGGKEGLPERSEGGGAALDKHTNSVAPCAKFRRIPMAVTGGGFCGPVIARQIGYAGGHLSFLAWGGIYVEGYILCLLLRSVALLAVLVQNWQGRCLGCMCCTSTAVNGSPLSVYLIGTTCGYGKPCSLSWD
jgi:hypothetical protein